MLFLNKPLFSFAFYIVMYILFFRSAIIEPARRLAIRIDFIPNIECYSITKIGLFGRLYNNLHSVEDLELIKINTEKENIFWCINKHKIDDTIAYKNKKTGELIYFENDGLWNWEGINHPLLNKNDKTLLK